MDALADGPSPPRMCTAPPVAVCAYSYACRRCRLHLFDDTALVPHDPLDGIKKNFKFRRGGPQNGEGGAASAGETAPVEACTSLFLDPDTTPWVAEEIREANADGAAVEPDTIYCPNPRCRAKLGTQSWTGSQCSCGAWITPAFRIHARAVDKVPRLP